MEPTTGFADVRSALLHGDYSQELPTWIGNLLVVAGQLMGLSVAGASGIKFLPEWLLEYCEKAKVSAGNVFERIISAMEDLFDRALRAIETRTLSALFETKFKEAPLIEASKILAFSPECLEVPGLEEGENVAVARLRYIGKTASDVQALYVSRG